MVFNATFNNISFILWWSVLLVEETGVPGENLSQNRQAELMDEIKNAIIEAKTGFELVLPSPDDFFIDMAEDLNKPKSVNDSENKTNSVILHYSKMKNISYHLQKSYHIDFEVVNHYYHLI
jgi:uncharacterized protein YpuA (DUF1002 family)